MAVAYLAVAFVGIQAMKLLIPSGGSGPPLRQEVLGAFREAFDPETDPDEEEREHCRTDGFQMVRELYEKHAEDFRPALAVEKRLQFEGESVSFLGYVN